MSNNTHDHTGSDSPSSQDSADVDALLSQSLKAQSDQHFTWKEPERKPRWWERNQAHSNDEESVALRQQEGSAVRGAAGSRTDSRTGIRPGSIIFALAALALAAWVVVSVVFGISIDPLLVGLVICAFAGVALVSAGLLPKPGTRM